MSERVMYLVRHGATANNLASPPVLQGCNIDAPLSPAGYQQAETVAELLSHRRLTAVYSSPLQRAKQTAQAIAQRHGHSLIVMPDLREANVGRWEGRSWVDIAQEEPDAYQNFQRAPDIYGYAGGENLIEVRDRVLPVMLRLLRESHSAPCVVVAHNVVNRAFLAHLLKIPIADARSIAQSNCGVNIIRLQRDEPIVETLNSTFHLSG
ncbi:MAG: histidine phosphatase family protein [Planctomycetota bacterium]|nr:histidine phosphatase family protein [Planctomycetota bacterium]MDA1180385.1 histidine phosphatase family protein [Planctomycetota bacterium]